MMISKRTSEKRRNKAKQSRASSQKQSYPGSIDVPVDGTACCAVPASRCVRKIMRQAEALDMVVLYDSELLEDRRKSVSLDGSYAENARKTNTETSEYTAGFDALSVAMAQDKSRHGLRFVDLSGSAVFGLNKYTMLQCCKLLAEALPKAWALKAISIRSVTLGDEGLAALAPGLQSSCANYVCLRDCALGERSGQLVASILRSQQIRRDEYIWKCNLRHHGAIWKSSSSFMSLDSADVHVGEAGVQVLDLADNPHLGGHTDLSQAVSHDEWLLGLNLMNVSGLDPRTLFSFPSISSGSGIDRKEYEDLPMSSGLVCLLTNMDLPSDIARALQARLAIRAVCINSKYPIAAAVLKLWAQEARSGFSLELLRSTVATSNQQQKEPWSSLARKIVETAAPSRSGKLHTATEFELAIRRAQMEVSPTLDTLLRAQHCRNRELFFKVNEGKGVTATALSLVFAGWALRHEKKRLDNIHTVDGIAKCPEVRFDLAEYLCSVLDGSGKDSSTILEASGLEFAFRRAEQAARVSWLSACAALTLRALARRLGETPLEAWVASLGSGPRISLTELYDGLNDGVEPDPLMASTYVLFYAQASSTYAEKAEKHANTKKKKTRGILATELLHAITLALDDIAPDGGGAALARVVHVSTLLQLTQGPYWTVSETARQILIKLPRSKYGVIQKHEIVRSLRRTFIACGIAMSAPITLFDDLSLLRIKFDALASSVAFERRLYNCRLLDRMQHAVSSKKANYCLDKIDSNNAQHESGLDIITLREAWVFCRSVCDSLRGSKLSIVKLEDCIRRARRSAFDAKQLRYAAAKVAVLRNELLKRRVDLDAWLEAAEKIVFSANKSESVSIDELRIGLDGLMQKSIELNENEISNLEIEREFFNPSYNFDARSVVDDAVAALVLFSRVDKPNVVGISELRRANARAAAAALSASMRRLGGTGPTDDDLADFLEADENPSQRRVARALDEKILTPNNWRIPQFLSFIDGGGPDDVDLLISLHRHEVFALRSHKDRAYFDQLTKCNGMRTDKKRFQRSKLMLAIQQKDCKRMSLRGTSSAQFEMSARYEAGRAAATRKGIEGRAILDKRVRNTLPSSCDCSLNKPIGEVKEGSPPKDVDILDALESAVLNIAHRIDDIERRLA